MSSKFNQPKLCMAPQISRFRHDLQLICTDLSHRPSLDVKMMAGARSTQCTGPGVTKLFQLRWSWYHLQHLRLFRLCETSNMSEAQSQESSEFHTIAISDNIDNMFFHEREHLMNRAFVGLLGSEIATNC